MNSTPQIILFGDSLTEWGFKEENRGYGWALQQYYGENAQVLNRGFAGYNSTNIRDAFQDIIQTITSPSAAPTLLFAIFLGANDACLPPLSAHVPLPQFEANIRTFVEQILTQQTLEGTKVVLITPPPISVPQCLQGFLEFWPPEHRSNELTELKRSMPYRTYRNKELYAKRITEIARSFESEGHNVVGLDLWTALIDSALDDEGRLGAADRYDEDRLPGIGLSGAQDFREGYFHDGLHFDHRAYEILSRILMEVAFKKWPELDVKKIQSTST